MENSTKVMVYDDTCPMCQAYTKGFVHIGILPSDGRQCFSELPPEIRDRLDLDRGRHEIPLYDTATGETIYGKHALFFLLSSRWSWLKPLFDNSVFQAIVDQAYQIVTYNRRLIAGSRPPKSGFDCAPDFNVFYRTVYLFIAVLLSKAATFRLANFDTTHFAILLLLPLFAMLAVAFFPAKRMDFLGHWATVWLITQLLLIPFWWIPLPFQPVLGLSVAIFAYFFYKRIDVLKDVSAKTL